jgi:16S rRNA (adenine1518-N6/adenine1519-N6)-dimethyltransferase
VNVKKILATNGLSPSKQRGQNFLVNRRYADGIVAASSCGAEDTVIEAGVGLGMLTCALAPRVKNVIGVEIDGGLIEYHRLARILPENVELIHGDILTVDYQLLSSRFGRLKIVSNLPYSISHPFLFTIVDHAHCIEQVTVLLQKEVAERLKASVGTKLYGISTVLLNQVAVVEKLFTIRPEAFHPRPKVDSTLVRLTIRPQLPGKDEHAQLCRIVRGAFATRRKTLVNNLAALAGTSTIGHGSTKEVIKQCLSSIGIVVDVRAEQLTIDQFIALKAQLSQAGYPL